MVQDIELGDLLDLEHLQHLQDAFAAVSRITTVVIGARGEPLTRPSNLYGFCDTMQSHPVGHQKCQVTNASLCEQNYATGGPSIMTCPHSGLTTAAVPILWKGHYMGSWIIGQARIGDPSDEVLAKTAADLDMDAAELCQMMENLPVLSTAEFDHIFDFLKVLSETILQLGGANRRLAVSNSELQAITQQYVNTSLMLRKFTDSTDIGMYISDFETGDLLMVNRSCAELAGMPADQLIGGKCWELVGPPNGEDFCRLCPKNQLLDEEGKPTAAHVWESYNPRFRSWLRVTNQAIRWVDGRLAQMVTFLDMTAQHNLQAELARLAYYDRQMDIPNSVKLQQDVAVFSGREDHYLICFDVASLRRINDAYGRKTGDRLLEAIVSWVRNQDFNEAILYRVEGDEFCLYFKNVRRERAESVGAAIYARFSKPWALSVDGNAVSVLCGVSAAVISLCCDPLDENILSLIERMLDISRSEERLVIHNEDMDRSAMEHVRMEISLRNCVQNDMEGFDVFFQAIVDPAAGMWKGLEALCRWRDPETDKPIPPMVFIPKAEQLGLIRSIGMWVMQKATHHCKEWRLDEVDGFFLSVNVSPIQIMDPGFSEKVLTLLEEQRFPGKNLFLEITESTKFNFSSGSMDVIDSLRDGGVRFSLDDFGTGYSSFNRLKKMPASIVKTEREFVWGIEEDSYMQYLFYSMVELAHAADMRLIAEGVETREQLKIVLKNRADFLQGYFFSRPLCAADLEKQLHRFAEVDPLFYSASAQPFDLEQLYSGKDAHAISPKLFRILNQSMYTLLSRTNTDEAINEVLELVANYFNVSRCYVFKKKNETLYGNTHEWCAPDVISQKEHFASVKIDELAPSWMPLLEQNGMIVSSDISNLPGDIYASLREQDIRSVAVLPMQDGEEIIGFLGFDDQRFREWLPEEIAMLRSLALIMASTIKRDTLQRRLYRVTLKKKGCA